MVQLDTVRVKPTREVIFNSNGLLLSCGRPRYESYQEYVDQFCRPVSSLPSSGIHCFHDVLRPSIRIMIECTEIDWCRRCNQSLDECSCMF
jgi:hypothetical protein